MTHPDLARALVAALVLVPALGWTAFEVATTKYTFSGDVRIWADKELPNGKWKAVDEFRGSGLRFTSSVAKMATGNDVRSDWVLKGRTEKGRVFTVRLAGLAKLEEADLKTGSLTIALPLTWTVGNQTLQNVVRLSTNTSVAGADGALRGHRMSFQNGSWSGVLVGQTSTDAEVAEISTGDTPRERSSGDAEARPVAVGQKAPNATPLFLNIMFEGTLREAAEQ